MTPKLMNLKILFQARRPLAVLSLLLFLSQTTVSLRAQSSDKADPAKPAPAANPEKAEQILQQAAAALGGNSYLNITTITGRGIYTLYKEGQPGLSLTFTDYIVYPDKERTEFRGDGFKTIQVNTGETGWIFDGSARSLKDLKPAQISDFKLAMRINIDNLLRGLWRKEGAKISYAGRREAGLAKRNETVRVAYPDGFTVEFEFGAQDHLPAKTIYLKKHPENEGEFIKEEDRMAQYLNLNGILAPFVIDHYSAGVQTSRTNYQSIEFNAQIAESLFARPASAKAVK